MPVKHSTLADGTFSAAGTAAWNANHTVEPGSISTTELGGDITAAGKALLDDASASDQRTTLGLAIGSQVQAYSANLDEYAAVNPTAAGLAILDDADAAAQRVTLGVRDTLTAARTYYVRADGSDSNTGLANTAGGAFLTGQKAFDVIKTLDLGGFLATMSLGAGTFAGIDINAPIVGGNLDITGAGVASTTISEGTLNGCIVLSVGQSALVTLSGFKVISSGTTSGIRMNAGGRLLLSTIEFGACGGRHMFAAAPGAFMHRVSGTNYTISGGATVHVEAAFMGYVRSDAGTVTLTGTPAFSTGFAAANNGGGMLVNSIIFSGVATGPRYVLGTGGIINTAGGGATYLPGNSAGTNTDTTGVYV